MFGVRSAASFPPSTPGYSVGKSEAHKARKGSATYFPPILRIASRRRREKEGEREREQGSEGERGRARHTTQTQTDRSACRGMTCRDNCNSVARESEYTQDGCRIVPSMLLASPNATSFNIYSGSCAGLVRTSGRAFERLGEGASSIVTRDVGYPNQRTLRP